MQSRLLLALTASALALPGLAPLVRADSPPAEATLAYRISNYSEDDLDAAKKLIGSSERYDIDIHQLQLTTPVGDNYGLTLRASRENMSGASPWYTIAQGNGSAAVIMSGATIHEERTDVAASTRRYLANGSVGVSLGYSDENDYEALSGGVDAERHFNDNLTTLAGGISVSNDDLSPTDAARFNRITDASKQSRSLYFAVTQVINQNSLLQSGLSYTHVSGYLSDPYKLFDIRPDSRSQLAWTTSWRQYLGTVDAALHADYRYYHDSFGINSHTLELQWHQNLGSNWQLVPGIRYYSQSEADFFRPGSVFGTTLPASADYRLAAYGAVSGELKLQVDLDDFTLSLAAERYRASESLGVHAGATSPALVNFTRLSLGVDYRY